MSRLWPQGVNYDKMLFVTHAGSYMVKVAEHLEMSYYIRSIPKETSWSLECAKRWQYRCLCNKEWFRQERGSSLPTARGSRLQVTWLKASRSMCQSSNAVTLRTVQTSLPAIAIFGLLKKSLRANDSPRMKMSSSRAYVRKWLTTQPREFYKTAIHRLVSQWYNSQGKYFWHTGTGFCS